MKDTLINVDDGTIFKNGDINTGTSDEQHKRLLLICEKGSFKEFPASCVGAATYLESENEAELLREVRTQFISDGMTVKKVAFEDNKLKVNASY